MLSVIGWRPYLLTLLALVVLGAVALDVVGAGKQSPSCTAGDGLERARQFVTARTSYATVLVKAPSSACAKRGMSLATYGECVAAQRIGGTDATGARAQLLKIAESEPPPGPRSCVWTDLQNLAMTNKPK